MTTDKISPERRAGHSESLYGLWLFSFCLFGVLCGFVLLFVFKFFPQPITSHEKLKSYFHHEWWALEQWWRLCQSKKDDFSTKTSCPSYRVQYLCMCFLLSFIIRNLTNQHHAEYVQLQWMLGTQWSARRKQSFLMLKVSMGYYSQQLNLSPVFLKCRNCW